MLTASNTTPKDDPGLIIGLAYAEYYINGLADILYADILWSFLISRRKADFRELYLKTISHYRTQLSTPYQYDEITNQAGIHIRYWPVIVTDPWRWASLFAKKHCGYNGQVDKKTLRLASLTVQRQNSQNNHELAQVLKTHRPSTDTKVLVLCEVWNELEQNTSFLDASAAAQEGAAGWDRLFTRIV